MNNLRYVRMVRTPSSERLLLQSNGQDVGAIDLHFADGGRVIATLVILDEASRLITELESLVTEIDEILLPDASREDGNIVLTVVKGSVIGSYVGKKDAG